MTKFKETTVHLSQHQCDMYLMMLYIDNIFIMFDPQRQFKSSTVCDIILSIKDNIPPTAKSAVGGKKMKFKKVFFADLVIMYWEFCLVL